MTLSAPFSLLVMALGWAVVHSLWQIALIWVIFKALSWMLRGRNQAIYRLSLVAMLASAGWFSATLQTEYGQIALAAKNAASRVDLPEASDLPMENALAGHTILATPSLFDNVRAWLESHALQVGWAWSICVVLLWLRLLGGWWMAQRLRRRDVVSPDTVFQERCRVLSEKLKINALVKLLESPHVREPVTLGFLKPVILFPAGMLLSLSPAQVEALILHELAHIRRFDYVVNLFQLALETCFFYHPLFWMISRDARVRREFCCDDVVLSHTSDPILYAKTLTDLQLSLLHPTTQFTMNATGKSRFTERILRIAGMSPRRESRPNWLIVMLLPTLLALCSWWPSPAVSRPLDTADNTIAVTDTLPPASATHLAPPAAARPKVEGKAAGQNKNDGTVQNENSDGKAHARNYAIEVVKMNVLYIGVDNPIHISVDGVPASELTLEIDHGGKVSGADGDYNVQVKEPGEVTISIYRREGAGKALIGLQKYRVKRIPDPMVALGGVYKGGVITKEKFLANKNIEAILANFDMDAVCEVVGFEITILPKEQDPISNFAVGATIPSNAWERIENLAGDGDAIFFDDIKVKCPGDTAPRNIGGIAFKLKPTQ